MKVYALPNLARTTTEIGSGLLPTPRATDGFKGTRTLGGARKELKRGRNMDLGMVAKLWPTPGAGLGKLSYSENSDRYYEKRIRDGRQADLASEMYKSEGSGQLNPTFVEWLMGFPIGHTDLKDSETQ